MRAPLGQTLIITSGLGWIQREGGSIEEARPSDVVWFPPGLNLAWRIADDGDDTHRDPGIVDVEWMEKVSDEQYRRT